MEEEPDLDIRCLEIKKLKEKVKSLVPEAELLKDLKNDGFIYNGKNQHENDSNSIFGDSKTFEDSKYDENEDDFLEFSDTELADERIWLIDKEDSSRSIDQPLEEIRRIVYVDINDNRPDVTFVLNQLHLIQRTSSSSLSTSSSISISNERQSIDSRTFTRPKKCASRPSLNAVVNSSDDERRKLQRRLTTTIMPTPDLISKLEELSRNNNRPVSGNYSDANWEDGSEEGLAEVEVMKKKSRHRQSIPASLFERLQELKRSNNSFALRKSLEPMINGNTEPENLMEDAEKVTSAFKHNASFNYRLSEIIKNTPDYTLEDESVLNVADFTMDETPRENIAEDARKVTAAFRRNASFAMGCSEIFGNIPEYVSDENESFINVDELSVFCDRLTFSADQSAYFSIVEEMETHDVGLFRRISVEESNENRLTLAGLEIPTRHFVEEIPARRFVEEIPARRFVEEINGHVESNHVDSNETTTCEKDEDEGKINRTFEIKNENVTATKRMNETYNASEKKPAIMDVLSKTDVIKNLSPNCDLNNCNDRNEGNNMLNNTYDKINATFNKNEINSMHNEKYTSKIFDATYRKSSLKKISPPENIKKDSNDHSEDDCMSTTSDHSNRSVESNSELKNLELKNSELKNLELKNLEELKTIALQQNKRLTSTHVSTPKTNARHSLDRLSFSPIGRESGDVESQGSSNASSRGSSPRINAISSAEGLSKTRVVDVRRPLKVPQRELKLKPALIRPSQNFKKSINNLKTVSEPSFVQKPESSTYVPVIRPTAPPIVPSTTTRPSSRTSGIPRPPSKLKPPQIRTSADPIDFLL